jgi:DNA-binding NtrC family response regulator
LFLPACHRKKFGKILHPDLPEDEGAISALIDHDWPGNVRELKNLLQATFINVGSGGKH